MKKIIFASCVMMLTTMVLADDNNNRNYNYRMSEEENQAKTECYESGGTPRLTGFSSSYSSGRNNGESSSGDIGTKGVNVNHGNSSNKSSGSEVHKTYECVYDNNNNNNNKNNSNSNNNNRY